MNVNSQAQAAECIARHESNAWPEDFAPDQYERPYAASLRRTAEPTGRTPGMPWIELLPEGRTDAGESRT